jgi:paired amphipathic helix protein Sin3a
VCSGRTELCNEVLNDTWVSMPTGSEEGTFKNLRKNQYEEMLFKCEDDRFELDLVIELNASTVKALEPLMKTINELTEEESQRFKLDTSLDSNNFTIIMR